MLDHAKVYIHPNAYRDSIRIMTQHIIKKSIISIAYIHIYYMHTLHILHHIHKIGRAHV